MKTAPTPPASEAPVRPYWRGLDELASSPEFRQWLDREFPDGATEPGDAVSRRHFMQIMSASFLLAGLGLTGCRRPEQHILPFGKQPEHYIHGLAELYATAFPVRGSALPLLVRANEGRPTKIEGNPAFRRQAGDAKAGAFAGTDHYAQASVLSLYDPDRAQRFARQGAEWSREAAFDYLAQLGKNHAAKSGAGLAFLVQRSSSPSRQRLIQLFSRKFSQARWFLHEPVDFEIHRQAASLACGKSAQPLPKLGQARVILSLDCDFLGAEEHTDLACADFAASRKAAQSDAPMSRLYAIEPLMSLTGVNADHRLRVPASLVSHATALLARRIIGAGAAALPASSQGLFDDKTRRWIEGCADDLIANKGKGLVIAGHRQPLAVHLLAHAINAALGNIGQTVELLESPVEKFGSISELAGELRSGSVETLVILGGNPVYDAPADLAWTETQRMAKTVLRWGAFEDETGNTADYHYPATHYLEAWGDARAADGTLLSIQPLIAPLFGGLTELEFLARLGGFEQTSPYEIVRETFRGFVQGGEFEERWKHFLHDGFLAKTALPAVTGQVDVAAVLSKVRLEPGAAPGRDQLELIFHRDYRVDDGRWSNNGWLQELPDPITKITWENVLLVSPKTAVELGLQSKDILESGRIGGQVVTITVGANSISGPLWIQPGMADYVVALALGYGRWRAGRVAGNAGYNTYKLRTTRGLHFVSGARMAISPETHIVCTTQSHGSQEGRPMVREAHLAAFKKDPGFARGMDFEEVPSAAPLYPNPLDQVKSTRHQWGMTIDLGACVGCQACVIACQSENNVPIVGKLMVGKGREMHWLRVDRYYAGSPEEPEVVNQPMFCQHCEAAPCENVCPVNATVHDQEGLNLMSYNRCVGTRYCSNNCPWKIRHFNFFDYNKRPLDKLYRSPFTTATDGQWELTRWARDPAASNRPQDEWDLIQLVKNPNVTVRMRGVMEKCTFCVQRIEEAKIARKVRARDSGEVQVPDQTFTTACAQACPADAIVFGNLLDPNSRVSRLKSLGRDYATLEFLHTKPRVTYFPRVRNPNPAMPDYRPLPDSRAEFWKKHEDPHEAHRLEHGGPAQDTPSGKGTHL